MDVRGDDVTLRSGLRDTFVVGRLNLRTGTLTAEVEAATVRTLLATQPLLRMNRGGVRVDLIDADSRRAAEALIRWQVDLERYAFQLRSASP